MTFFFGKFGITLGWTQIFFEIWKFVLLGTSLTSFCHDIQTLDFADLSPKNANFQPIKHWYNDLLPTLPKQLNFRLRKTLKKTNTKIAFKFWHFNFDFYSISELLCFPLLKNIRNNLVGEIWVHFCFWSGSMLYGLSLARNYHFELC